MQQNETKNNPLQHLGETIALLDGTSKQLIGVMEDQIDAIIAADTEKIDSLSEIHSELSWRYKKIEEEFIAELEHIFEAHNLKQELRLVNLKQCFPEWEESINEWYSMLSQNAGKLQSKHKQVVQLLEFAMEQNARLMHSMYNKHGEKNLRYGANGDQASNTTGVAINQEA